MTPDGLNTFEKQFGFPVPPSLQRFLQKLLGDEAFRDGSTIKITFEHLPFIVDLMCLLDLKDPENYDVERKRLRFARDGDGFVLLIEFQSDVLSVMKEEFGDIDYLGLTVDDLLKGEIGPA